MKKFVGSVILSLMLPAAMVAQVLSIDECVRLAREHYPAVAQYGLVERVGNYDLANAAKAWLPHGGVSAQATWQNDIMTLPDALTEIMHRQGLDYPGIEKTQYKIGVDISQQIWDGGRTRANRRAIETASEVDRRSLDVQMYDVEGRVEELYFGLLLLNERIDRVEKTIDLLASTLHRTQSLYANGVARKSDCDQIEARLLSAGQQKSQLMASRDSYARILEIFIGEPIGERGYVLPEEPAAMSQEAAHPQLRLFDSRLQNITSREAGVKASVMPDIGAFFSGYYGYPGYNMFKSMQTRNMSFNFMVGVKVSWNFGALYTRQNTLKKLQTQRAMVDVERQTFLFNREVAASESSGRIDALRDVIRNDERIVELCASVMDAAQSQLDNGIIDATTLLTKITDYEQAENDFTLHRIELVKTMYNLNHIKNK